MVAAFPWQHRIQDECGGPFLIERVVVVRHTAESSSGCAPRTAKRSLADDLETSHRHMQANPFRWPPALREIVVHLDMQHNENS